VRFHPAFVPEALGNHKGFNAEIMPPGDFVADLMQLPMMIAAQRHRELITDLETQGPWLRETQMMWV